MPDIKMTSSGDIFVSDGGDIALTDSVRQAVLIKVKWILNEWRLGPDFGFPWYEEVLVKNPDLAKIRSLLRSAIMEVDGVVSAVVNEANIDRQKRLLSVKFTFVVGETTYREELTMNA